MIIILCLLLGLISKLIERLICLFGSSAGFPDFILPDDMSQTFITNAQALSFAGRHLANVAFVQEPYIAYIVTGNCFFFSKSSAGEVSLRPHSPRQGQNYDFIEKKSCKLFFVFCKFQIGYKYLECKCLIRKFKKCLFLQSQS